MPSVSQEETVRVRGSATWISPWGAAAALFCLLFGLVLVLIVHPDGDGGWFWYSVFFRRGQHLYRDLHLALQPMLVLEISTAQRLLGTRWIPSLTVGALNVVLLVAALAWVNRFCVWRSWQRALLLVCAFVTTADFITIRFDDYHVISSCLELFSLALLLPLSRSANGHGRWPILLGLGWLSGLCLTNRLNDGAALLAAVLFTVLWLGEAPGVIPALVVLSAAAFTTLGVIAITGDSPADWALYSIRRAAAIKGGTGNVLLYPLQLPWATVKHLFVENHRVTIAFGLALAIAGLAALLASQPRHRTGGRWAAVRSWPGALLILLLLAAAKPVFHGGAMASATAGILTLAMIVLLFVVLYRLALAKVGRPPALWSPLELLLLLPIGQLVSIAMSSARWYPNAFPPAAVFLLIVPIALAPFFSTPGRKTFFLTLVAILAVSAFAEKMRQPFHWWNYATSDLMARRLWYRHPSYGPMLIQADELALMKPVCDEIASRAKGPAQSPESRELLSLPFPYANYFCGIPPWHGYVQTFFDTSSKATIDSLVSELQADPPRWILYQRQMRVLRAHELAFQGGQPLPHRAIDALIMGRLQSGAWTATIERAPPGDDSEWMLIRTR